MAIQTLKWIVFNVSPWGLDCWKNILASIVVWQGFSVVASDWHHSDVIMGGWRLKSPTSPLFVYSTVYSGADQRKHESSGNSLVIGEFPAQMASDGENAFIWWRRHGHGFWYGYLSEVQNPSVPYRVGYARLVYNPCMFYLYVLYIR